MTVARLTKNKTQPHERKLRQLNAEVEALRRQLRRTQRLAAVGTMTAMVAHEFNNILTPIINYARLARQNPDLLEKALDRAASGGERAAEICKAILGMTQDSPAKPERIRLAEVVADTLAAMARDPKKDGIELSVDVPERLSIKARRVELQQVLVNLLTNARRALLESANPRRLEISASRNGSHALISVADTGVGIAPENIERIFEPLFTTDKPSKGSSNGHGLGLAICKDIVEGMRGRITVESQLGRGSKFTIHLPA